MLPSTVLNENEAAPAPAYRRIQATLREEIAAGIWRVGALVPSERELARRHAVSLMTARHAVTELEREGLVERRRGAGTFVAAPRIQFNKLQGLGELIRALGLAPSSKIVSFLPAYDAAVAARLSRPATVPLLRLERLHCADGEPFALVVIYVVAADFAQFPAAQLERESLLVLLERRYGVVAASADEEVEATGADLHAAQLLRTPGGTPLLRIRQVMRNARKEPFLYAEGLYRGDRHSLLIRRFR